MKDRAILCSRCFLVGILALAATLPSDKSEVICQADTGYQIRSAELLLPRKKFREDMLRRVFAPYATASFEGEWYVVASSDSSFFRGQRYIASEPGVCITDAPVAYFFRVGMNVFFEFGVAGGEIRWVVIRGDNIFHRRFGKTEIRLVGQDFPRLAGENTCERQRRLMVFTSPEVREEDLVSIARYYNRIGSVNGEFSFSIFESAKVAAAFQTVRFPVLEAMPFYSLRLNGKLTEQETKPGHSYYFHRINSTEGEYIRYDEEGPGPPTWTKRIRLE